MSLEKAARQALEALEDACRLLDDEGYSYAFQHESIIALRQAFEQRKWISITEDELTEIREHADIETLADYARAIEAKLKEKNT